MERQSLKRGRDAAALRRVRMTMDAWPLSVWAGTVDEGTLYMAIMAALENRGPFKDGDVT